MLPNVLDNQGLSFFAYLCTFHYVIDPFVQTQGHGIRTHCCTIVQHEHKRVIVHAVHYKHQISNLSSILMSILMTLLSLKQTYLACKIINYW